MPDREPQAARRSADPAPRVLGEAAPQARPDMDGALAGFDAEGAAGAQAHSSTPDQAAAPPLEGLTPRQVLALQGIVGNRVVSSVMRSVAQRVPMSTPSSTETLYNQSNAAGQATAKSYGGGVDKYDIEFELEPPRCTVHFSQGGQPITWLAMPELGSGFVTTEAEGLGGLRRRAKVKPGAYGATAFDIPAPGNAAAVSIEVAGWLAEAFPDERLPEPFAVRTEEAPIPTSPPKMAAQ